MLRCSFCGKSEREVDKLIAGPAVYICDGCIDLCNDILITDAVGAEVLTAPKRGIGARWKSRLLRSR